jgi:signal transduction histidine kinase
MILPRFKGSLATADSLTVNFEVQQPTRPSRWWLALAGMSALMAVGFAVATVVVQRSATRPIGEGVLFVEEAAYATELLTDASNPTTAAKTVRNELEIEAVSLVSEEAVTTASTSANLVGRTVENDFLRFSIGEGRFAAIGAPIDAPIRLDGVNTWETGDVLYLVAQPLTEGGAALLHYDISELLARRTGTTGIQGEALQMGAISAVLGVIALALGIGHTRATQRQQSMAKESDLLREHTLELGAANTQLERARRRAERALELAEEKIRIRSEFVLMINHELRTPLTSVITGARLLRDEELGEQDRRRVLDAIVDDGTRLQEMIDQILAVARIENRGLAYELNEVSLSELIDTISSANASIEPANGDIEDLRLLTDLGAMGLVVSSLADNARTHGASAVAVSMSSRRQVEPMVEVGEDPQPACFIAVSDDGPGIDPDFLPRVFEKFEKSSFSPGTGLGLYMARTIIEALDGSISVETTTAGTTFEIAIPTVEAREPVGQS